MDDILRGKVISPRELGIPDLLLMPLQGDDLCAVCPKLHPGGRVDDVIDAAMRRQEAAEQRCIPRIDDGIRIEAGDVPLPMGDVVLDLWNVVDMHDAALHALRPEERILIGKDLGRNGQRIAGIHVLADDPALALVGRTERRDHAALAQKEFEDAVAPLHLFLLALNELRTGIGRQIEFAAVFLKRKSHVQFLSRL